jgi:hypothetical protein
VNQPSRAALEEQNHNLRMEVEHLRHFLKDGDSRLSLHLYLVHRADAWRHRTRADAFATQLRALGAQPSEPTIPPLPPPTPEDDTRAARWLADMEIAKRKTEEAA